MRASVYVTTGLISLLPLAGLLHGIGVAVAFAVIAACLFWSYEGWRYPLRPLPSSLKILALLSVWPLLSVFWSITPGVTLVTTLRTCGMLLAGAYLVWMVAQVADKKPAIHIDGRGYVLSVMIAILILWTQYLPQGGLLNLGAHVMSIDYERYISKNINRGLCAFAVLGWPALIVLEGQGRKRFAMLMPVLFILAIASMHSLSAKMGVVAGSIIFYLLMLGMRRTLLCGLWGIWALLLAWPALFYAGEGWLRESVYAQLPESSQHRIEIWHFALLKWHESPLLGWGVDTSRAIPGGLEQVRPGWVMMPMHPHNVFFQLLLEQGAIGYALAMSALGWLLRRFGGKIKSRDVVVAATMAGISAFVAVSFSAFNLWQAWWLCSGLLMLALCRVFSTYKKPENY